MPSLEIRHFPGRGRVGGKPTFGAVKMTFHKADAPPPAREASDRGDLFADHRSHELNVHLNRSTEPSGFGDQMTH